jgi:hypothetical protein
LLPAVRAFNSAKSKGFLSRLSLVEEVPAYDFLNGDIVTEEYSTVQLTLSAPITAAVGALVVQDITGAEGYLIGDVSNETVITVASLAATFNTNFNIINNLTVAGDSTPSTTNTTTKPNLVGTTAGNVPANFVLSNANEGQYLNLRPDQTYSFTNGSIVTSANDNVQGTVTSTRFGVLDTVDNGGITPGTLYTPASGTVTYTYVPLTSVTGTGTGGIADITVTNGVVTSVDLRRGGTGYAVGNLLSAAVGNIGGTGSGFQIPVTGIEQRVYVSLLGGERFTATLASPNFVADNNAPVKAITASGTATKTFSANTIGGNVDYVNYNIFLRGLPVKPVIDTLYRFEGSRMFILSASPNSFCNQQKKTWLKEHFPIVNEDDIIFVGKATYKPMILGQLLQKYKIDKKDCTFIDDFHELLAGGLELGVNAMHPSEFLAKYYKA